MSSFPLFSAGGTVLASAGQLLGTSPTLVLEPWGGTGPTPGAALALDSQSPLPKTTYSLPGLGLTPRSTLFLVFNKAAAAEAQHVACSIATQDGVYLSLLYGGTNSGDPAVQGFGLNSYTSASASLPGYPLANEQLVLVRARIPNSNASAGQPFEMALNGVAQQLQYKGAGVSRPLTNTFTLGGFLDDFLVWQGSIYACYLYLGDLTEAECQRTEAYLRGLHPAVN